MKIHKYRLAFSGKATTLSLPMGTSIALVGAQDGVPMIWLRGDFDSVIIDGADTVERHFHVAGTGWDIDPYWQHVGSFQDGSYVWHVFEESEQDDE